MSLISWNINRLRAAGCISIMKKYMFSLPRVSPKPRHGLDCIPIVGSSNMRFGAKFGWLFWRFWKSATSDNSGESQSWVACVYSKICPWFHYTYIASLDHLTWKGRGVPSINTHTPSDQEYLPQSRTRRPLVRECFVRSLKLRRIVFRDGEHLRSLWCG